MAESGEDITTCPVCSKSFKAKGEHIPRLLPCTHTVCERCIRRKLIRKYNLDCPQCGETHSVKNGVESFQKNKYILKYIGKPDVQQHAVGGELCIQHKRTKNLFCNELGCKTEICVLCLKDEHKYHDFCDLEEVKETRCKALMANVRSLKKKLYANKVKLSVVQRKESKSGQTCIMQINRNRKELIKMINERADKLVKEVSIQVPVIDANINDAQAKIGDALTMLASIEDGVDTITYKAIADGIESVKKIRIQVKDSLSKVRSYYHVCYKENENTIKYVKKLCGEVTSDEKRIKLMKIGTSNKDDEVKSQKDNAAHSMKSISDMKKLHEEPRKTMKTDNYSTLTENIDDTPLSQRALNCQRVQMARVEGSPPAKKMRVDEGGNSIVGGLHCRVFRNSRSVDYNFARLMSVLSDDSVIVYGKGKSEPSVKKVSQWKFTRYSRPSGTILENTFLNTLPTGMAEVTLAGQRFLALSFGKKGRIKFYDVKNLRVEVQSYSVAPLRPGRLCTLSSDTLLYVSWDSWDSQREREVVTWLNCRHFPPIPTNVTDIDFQEWCQGKEIQDMVTHGDKGLLITAHCSHGIHAYDAVANKLEWTAKGQFPGMYRRFRAVAVAVDESNRLFVSDTGNKRIQIFSLHGVYLGPVMMPREQVLGESLKLRWCQRSLSLIVFHVKRMNEREKCFISDVKVL